MKTQDIPEEAKQLRVLGREAESAGQLDRAEESYAKAVEIYPEYATAWSDLAHIHRDKENVLAGIITLETGIEHCPESSLLLANLGTFYCQAGIFGPRAEDALRKSIQLDPNGWGTMLNLALLLSRKGENDEAEDWLEQAKKIAAENAAIWAAAVQIYADHDKCQQASDSLQHLRGLNPNPAVLKQVESYFLAKCKDANTERGNRQKGVLLTSDNVEDLLRAGDSCIEEARYEEAESYYRRATTVDDTNAVAWGNLGVVLSILNKSDEATNAFEKSLKIDKTSGVIWGSFGSHLKRMGKYSKAESALKKAIKYGPEIPMSWHNYGNLLSEKHNFRAAVRMYSKAIELNDKNPRYWEGYGQANLKLRNHVETDRAFRKVIELDPENASVLRALGFRDAYLGNNESALGEIDRYLKLEPDDAACWLLRGRVTLALKMYDDSVDSFKQTVKLDESNAESLFALAAIYFSIGNLTYASRYINKALQVTPKDQKTVELNKRIVDKMKASSKFVVVGDNPRMFIDYGDGLPLKFFLVNDTEGDAPE